MSLSLHGRCMTDFFGLTPKNSLLCRNFFRTFIAKSPHLMAVPISLPIPLISISSLGGPHHILRDYTSTPFFFVNTIQRFSFCSITSSIAFAPVVRSVSLFFSPSPNLPFFFHFWVSSYPNLNLSFLFSFLSPPSSFGCFLVLLNALGVFIGHVLAPPPLLHTSSSNNCSLGTSLFPFLLISFSLHFPCAVPPVPPSLSPSSLYQLAFPVVTSPCFCAPPPWSHTPLVSSVFSQPFFFSVSPVFLPFTSLFLFLLHKLL